MSKVEREAPVCRGSEVGFWNLSAGVGSGSRIKDSLTFNISSRGHAAVEFKELIHGVDAKKQKYYDGIKPFVD